MKVLNLRAASRIQGQGVKSLAPGASVVIDNKDPNTGRSESTVQLVVSNFAQLPAAGQYAAAICLCSTDGNEAVAIFPQTAVTFESDSEFRLLNPSRFPDGSINSTTVYYAVGMLYVRDVSGGAQSQAGGGSSATRSASQQPGSFGVGGATGHYQLP